MKRSEVVLISIATSVVTVGLIFLFGQSPLNNLWRGNSSVDPTPPLASRPATGQTLSVEEVVAKVSPAVVSVVVSKDVPIIERYYREFDPFSDDPFDNFFGGGLRFQIPELRQRGTEKREIGGGSGFFISADGLVMTNRHVVDDPKAEYTVLTNDGKKYPAQVLARDRRFDVAILKVRGQLFPYLKFGDSDALRPGQTVIAIGNALGEFRNSVSVGVVSGIARSIVAGDYSGRTESLEGVIQTDAAINPGNSGGPLLNLRGEVIGVNVAMEQGAENIGFALPANVVRRIAETVKIHGEVVRPYFGVRYILITPELKEKNNLPVDYGALVRRGADPNELAVIPGSPADKAGLVENDIILEFAGVKLTADQSLLNLIQKRAIGETVKLKIWHRGQIKDIELKLEKAPQDF